LTEVLRGALGELLSRDDVKELVVNAKKVAPAVVEELVPARIGFGEVQAVLKNLLRDGVLRAFAAPASRSTRRVASGSPARPRPARASRIRPSVGMRAHQAARASHNARPC
jgi:hypothetical protein